MKKQTYRETITNVLDEVMDKDQDIILLGEDIRDPYGGAFKVTKGLSKRYSDRVLNMPISESMFVGLAAGLCVKGMKAVVEIMFADFITLCFDQVCNHASKFNMMYNLKSKTFSVTIRMPSGGGRGYGPTHSQSTESRFLGLPGVKVFAPALCHSIAVLYKKIIAETDVSLVVESKLDYPRNLQPLEQICCADEYRYGTYKNKSYEHNPDLTILTYGTMFTPVFELVQELDEEGIGIDLLIPERISPLDFHPLVESLVETGNLLIVEEGHKSFGWGESVAGNLAQHHFDLLENRIEIIGSKDFIIPNSQHLERTVIPGYKSIKSRIMEYLHD